MDFWKGLKSTTIVAGAAGMLALGTSQAQAVDDVAVIGHASASVVGNLAVEEVSAINFGNLTFTGGTCAPCAGDGTIVMTDQGTRTAANAGTDKIALLAGIDQSGLSSGTNFETGSQHPGFYTITTTDNVTNATTSDVYVSFADINGAIVDTTYDPGTHPNNYVTLTGPGGGCFKLNQFTFETDDTTAGNGTSGYTQASAATTDIYGSWVPVTGGTATLRVGGTLTTISGCTPTPGQYNGSFYVMVSY